jgi:hypothetical protein
MLQFKIFDIIAKLVPGLLIMTILLPFTYFLSGGLDGELSKSLLAFKDYSAITTSVFFAICFIIGTIINMLSSDFEEVLWKLWGGRPSNLLLNDKVKSKPLNNPKEILAFLQEKTNIPALQEKTSEQLRDKDFGRLFQTAKNICNNQKDKTKSDERIEDFLNSYILMRNLLVTMIFNIAIVLLWFYLKGISIWLFLSLLLITFLIYQRCKKQGIYHTREVFNRAYSTRNIAQI